MARGLVVDTRISVVGQPSHERLGLGRMAWGWRVRYLRVAGRRCCGIVAGVTYEQLPDEWKEWLDLTPLERFRRSEELFAQYLAMGGSLDPDPDPTSPFDFPDQWRPGAAHGRAGLRLLRRGAS